MRFMTLKRGGVWCEPSVSDAFRFLSIGEEPRDAPLSAEKRPDFVG